MAGGFLTLLNSDEKTDIEQLLGLYFPMLGRVAEGGKQAELANTITTELNKRIMFGALVKNNFDLSKANQASALKVENCGIKFPALVPGSEFEEKSEKKLLAFNNKISTYAGHFIQFNKVREILFDGFKSSSPILPALEQFCRNAEIQMADFIPELLGCYGNRYSKIENISFQNCFIELDNGAEIPFSMPKSFKDGENSHLFPNLKSLSLKGSSFSSLPTDISAEYIFIANCPNIHDFSPLETCNKGKLKKITIEENPVILEGNASKDSEEKLDAGRELRTVFGQKLEYKNGNIVTQQELWQIGL